MAIAAIYILIALTITLFSIGLFKQDYTLTLFGGMLFIIAGLTIFINGFEDLITIYAKMFGIIVIFIGCYITTRAGVELIEENM